MGFYFLLGLVRAMEAGGGVLLFSAVSSLLGPGNGLFPYNSSLESRMPKSLYEFYLCSFFFHIHSLHAHHVVNCQI